ncbi:hypothetical protein F503_06846 [Ophiostoma piceae UAMH 11346]|uniref:Uncharacterized protein n=1 Tax=Ophiostoma piceae (strain UAMH 11346) TaxID=1262450 RepID=S3D6N5_OPHP1|nr:hypothetical protein F503_06846 [Ophiostoma piceae UAMH 11346]
MTCAHPTRGPRGRGPSGLLVHERLMMFRKLRLEIQAEWEVLNFQAAIRPVPVAAEKAKDAIQLYAQRGRYEAPPQTMATCSGSVSSSAPKSSSDVAGNQGPAYRRRELRCNAHKSFVWEVHVRLGVI